MLNLLSSSCREFCSNVLIVADFFLSNTKLGSQVKCVNYGGNPSGANHPKSVNYIFWVYLCDFRDQNGFRPKSLHARNAELGDVCMCLLNGPQMKHTLARVGLGVLFFGFWGRKQCIPVPFWVTVLQYPYPLPFQKKFSSDLHWSKEWSWELE